MLPETALTNATRLRWWQPFSLLSGLVRSSAERAQWALDNILVGGSDINPSTLLDTFDDGESRVTPLSSVSLRYPEVWSSEIRSWNHEIK